MDAQGILFFGRPGCTDCDNAKKVFEEEMVVYRYSNILENPEALADLTRICAEQGADARVPVIVLPPPYNTVFIEPQGERLEELRKALQAFKASARPETG